MSYNMNYNLYKNTPIKKNDLVLKMVFVVIGILSTTAAIFGDINTGTATYQFLLPFSYLIGYLILLPAINKMGYGYIVLNIVWIIRYCILPALNTLNTEYITQFDERYRMIALLIMLVELWVTFIAVRFCFSNLYKKKNKGNKIHGSFYDNLKPRVVFLFFIIFVVIILADPNALKGFNNIFDSEFTKRSSTNFGILSIWLNWTKYIVTISLIGIFGRKYIQTNSFFYVLSAILTMLISISFFQGVSRNGLLIEAVAYLFVLTKIFHKHSKKIIVIFIVSILFVLLSITLYKFYDIRSISEVSYFFNNNSFANELNLYFAGPSNVAIGVKTLDMFGPQYNILTIFKDLFANTVVLNKLVANIPGTVYFFNIACYGHTIWADQISPTITQAIGLFNVFGFIIPIILVYIIVKMDSIAVNSDSILGMFVATMFSVTLAFYSPGNITIISTSIFNKLLPLFIIYKFLSYKFRRN